MTTPDRRDVSNAIKTLNAVAALYDFNTGVSEPDISRTELSRLMRAARTLVANVETRENLRDATIALRGETCPCGNPLERMSDVSANWEIHHCSYECARNSERS